MLVGYPQTATITHNYVCWVKLSDLVNQKRSKNLHDNIRLINLQNSIILLFKSIEILCKRMQPQRKNISILINIFITLLKLIKVVLYIIKIFLSIIEKRIFLANLLLQLVFHHLRSSHSTATCLLIAA